MDKSNLMRGTVFQKADPGYDRTMHLAGVPRTYWNVKRDAISFSTFHQTRDWRTNGINERIESHFPAFEQQDIYDTMINIINGRVEDHDWVDYAKCGSPTVISSNPTDQESKRMAAFLVGEVQRKHPEAKTRWQDVNQRNRFGRFVTPDHDLFPELIVLTGLHPNPTSENWESVRCWTEWACRRCPCFLVGCGTDPMELSRRWYNIEPMAVLYAYNEIGESRTYG